MIGIREGEDAAVVFTATGPNTPGTVTELLLQKLVNIRRSAGVQYKSMAFVEFGVEAVVPVEPGAYVPAYQFVEAATGRVTGLIVLPRIEVP